MATAAPHLEPHFTVPGEERGPGRGCARPARPGRSGDAAAYRLEREFEDVAAVVDHVAAEAGEPVNLYGHSHGGIVAFGAAALTPNLRRLVLYEGWPAPDPSIYDLQADLVTRMDDLLAKGDPAGVVEVLFRSVEEMSDQDMAALREAPSWPGRVAAAHTVTREIAGEAQASVVESAEGRVLLGVERGDLG